MPALSACAHPLVRERERERKKEGGKERYRERERDRERDSLTAIVLAMAPWDYNSKEEQPYLFS